MHSNLKGMFKDQKFKYLLIGFMVFVVYVSIIGLKYLSDLSKNGRYTLSGQTNQIIDTRTGVVYSISDCDEYEPFNATVVNAKLPKLPRKEPDESSAD